jgi:D-alanyl-D-alanine carboxypeptidase/D-alanyl-D-alanine-endopeptidase (penicillin-binding protein 4)
VEFGLERIKSILPAGGSGSLEKYFKDEQGAIYAKTGTMSGVNCLSGYLITKKGKYFSAGWCPRH